MQCELAPGSVIIEADLTEWLGLGRTPVREALVSLANANLLRLSRGGVVIPELNAMTMLKLLELREPVERLCIEKAVARQNDADRLAFKGLLESLEPNSTMERDRFLGVLWDIHKALAAASQNEFVHTALRTTQGLSRRYWAYYSDAQDQELARHLYVALLKALLDRDVEAALNQSEKLMKYLRKFTLDSMKNLAGSV